MLRQLRPFQVLQEAFAVSRRAEQLRLRTHQRVLATAEDSVLRTELGELESHPPGRGCPQVCLKVQTYGLW